MMNNECQEEIEMGTDLLNNFEKRLTKLEVLMEQMITKQEEFNDSYKFLPADMVRLEEKTKAQQKEIDELQAKYGNITKWGWGIVATIVGMIIKMALGI